ncbi:MAG: LPS-assembly protein LptD [Bryobacteraceae bacterium]
MNAPLTFGQSINHQLKADLPAEDEIRFESITENSNPPMRLLHKMARIVTSDMVISADEIQYNSDSDWAYAQGHVHLEHFVTGDRINADHAEYNLRTQSGKFYLVDGTAPSKIVASPTVLTTTNPFYFQAKWAERIKNRYILHNGFLTDCTVKKPWWTFQAPVFDVIPGQRAIARNTVFRLKHVPIFYLPYFYRPLGKNPRQSGFLTPNVGHSSLYGYIFGVGYYWAINRSYDMTTIGEYFSSRGPALRYDFRGKPNEVTDFDFNLYGVNDRGIAQVNAPPVKQGGLEFELTAKTQILGFTGRLDYNYLSSYLFRQAFSYSFTSAISSDIYSIGFLQRHFWKDLATLNIVFQRDQLFQSITPVDQPANQVIIQKLPSFEFSVRDREIKKGAALPVWFSLQSSVGLLTRNEPIGTETNAPPLPSNILQTGALGRIDVQPRVMTEFNFKGFSLNPSMTLGATGYSNSYATNSTFYTPVSFCGGYQSCSPTPTNNVSLANRAIFRKDADFTVDFRAPTLERVFTPPKRAHLGEKLKHVMEFQATYEYVTGINQFRKTIHFDATDILSNTNQLTFSVTNRLYRKDKAGNIMEILTWRVAHARFFDPTFGGAVISGQPNIGFRNVVLASTELSPFAFLDGPRDYSPVISALTITPYSFFSFDYRTEYDPLRRRFIDHTISGTFRFSKYFASLSDTAITTNPVLLPQANQMSISGGYGAANRKGWNAAALVDFDVLLNRRLFNFFQVSYNTDCCGFSVQLRQYNLGIRNENQYLFSFSVANIGTFGSLQKQSRIF